jgi:hypothetical protein
MAPEKKKTFSHLAFRVARRSSQTIFGSFGMVVTKPRYTFGTFVFDLNRIASFALRSSFNFQYNLAKIH